MRLAPENTRVVGPAASDQSSTAVKKPRGSLAIQLSDRVAQLHRNSAFLLPQQGAVSHQSQLRVADRRMSDPVAHWGAQLQAQIPSLQIALEQVVKSAAIRPPVFTKQLVPKTSPTIQTDEIKTHQQLITSSQKLHLTLLDRPILPPQFHAAEHRLIQ